MVQDADRVDHVERPRLERQLEDVALDDQDVVTPAEVLRRGVDGAREVDADGERGAVARDDVEEPAHPAARLEHHVAADVVRLEGRLRSEASLGVGEASGVELHARERLPLQAERFGVGFAVHEAQHAVVGVARATGDALEHAA